MSVVEHHADAPPPKWVLGAIGAAAIASVAIGALIVEPAIHRLLSSTPLRAPPLPSSPAPSGRVEIGETTLQGRYSAAGSDRTLDVEGAVIALDDNRRLRTAPHRLVDASQPASTAGSFADVMHTPAGAQVEIRRVVEDVDTGLCDGLPVGWAVLAVRRDGFVLMPVREGPPPGSLLAADRLCPVLDLTR
jgi:hypothetical protein